MPTTNSRHLKQGVIFEEEVRRVARALWEADPGQGGADMIDGKERDCIFEQEHLTHYVECTAEETVAKIKKDSEKMVAYRDQQAKKGRLAKLWIITEYEPTAHQRELCRPRQIELLSLREFRRKVFDGTSYLELRIKIPFGSARDPAKDDSQDLSGVRYQPTALHQRGSNRSLSIAQVVEALEAGKVVVLLGDYGMGKSLSIREVFRGLRTNYLKANEGPAPVAINLRDYWGRDRPAEVLDRHARDVGLSNGLSLVRGFNAGQIIPLLDGFDETAAIPWATRDVQRLREVRRKAVEVARAFIEGSRGKTGLLIAGREHYFDNLDELRSALSLRTNDIVLSLEEFDEAEARAFLKDHNSPIELPDWLPRRPLLLSTFVARGLLDAVRAQQDAVDPARAWDGLIQATCEREARIHEFLDATAIRRMLEEIASRARTTETGLGPVSETDLAAAFRTETGAQPDNTAWPLLLRLPGLSARDAQPGVRYFIDDQMLSAFRAGQVASFAGNPRSELDAKAWRHGLDELGALSVGAKLAEMGATAVGALVAGARIAARSDRPTLALDLVQVARIVADEGGTVDFAGLEIADAYSPHLNLTSFAIPKNLVIRGSTFGRVSCTNIATPSLRLVDCLVEHVDGVARKDLLPDYIDNTCIVGEFDAFSTNAELMKDDEVHLPVRVLLTILRKLYLQGGSGRKENAFSRGMSNSAGRFVGSLLEIVRREGLATVGTYGANKVWQPVRSQRPRVRRLLESPTATSDPALLEAAKLR